MFSRYLAVALSLCAGACGKVGGQAPADSAMIEDDAPLAPPVSYAGRLDKSRLVQFGGGAPPPTCTFTMTLEDLNVELGIRPTGELVSGRITDVNVEGLVAACMYSPAGPRVAGYTLDTAIPTSGSIAVTFKNDSTNATKVAVTGVVAPNDTGYAVMLMFQRTDQVPLLNWLVMETLSLKKKT